MLTLVPGTTEGALRALLDETRRLITQANEVIARTESPALLNTYEKWRDDLRADVARLRAALSRETTGERSAA
jgi:hypothetical protein